MNYETYNHEKFVKKKKRKTVKSRIKIAKKVRRNNR